MKSPRCLWVVLIGAAVSVAGACATPAPPGSAARFVASEAVGDEGGTVRASVGLPFWIQEGAAGYGVGSFTGQGSVTHGLSERYTVAFTQSPGVITATGLWGPSTGADGFGLIHGVGFGLRGEVGEAGQLSLVTPVVGELGAFAQFDTGGGSTFTHLAANHVHNLVILNPADALAPRYDLTATASVGHEWTMDAGFRMAPELVVRRQIADAESDSLLETQWTILAALSVGASFGQ